MARVKYMLEANWTWDSAEVKLYKVFGWAKLTELTDPPRQLRV